jgi:plastocyanin
MIKNILIILFLLSTFIPVKGANKYSISVSNFQFTPANQVIMQGDTVVWTNASGSHNVNGSQATYPSNPVTFSSGAVASGTWTYTFVFNTPGAYSYRCNPHAPGMAGVITVNPVALPVELISFTTIVNQGNVTVEWKTANEIKAKTFELERSSNANVYETLKFIAANKTSSTYIYTDQMEKISYYYYRLKIINDDNTFQYSPVRLVYTDIKVKEDNVVISPNPSNSHFHITVNSKSPYTGTVDVLDMYGKNVIHLDGINFDEGSTYLHLDETIKLTKGLYFIVIKNAKTAKFISSKALKV